MSSRNHTRKPRRIPSYRLHSSSGRAVVTVDGRDHYLGPHGSDESHEAYNRLIAEWMANGYHLPSAGEEGITIVELAARYGRIAR